MNTAEQVRPRGRRRGTTESREVIAASARELFADRGFDAVSIRAIATHAGVDPALVLYFYGSKRELFASLIQLPFDASVVPRLMAEGAEGLGVRVARYAIAQMRAPGKKEILVSLLRTVGSDCEAATVLRERYLRDLLEPVAAAIQADRPQLRAALCWSQLVGLALGQHVVEIPSLLDADPETLAAIYGPTLQRYLTEPLPG